jgi:pimeloyl-ACP methyl ester carboxylesterase
MNETLSAGSRERRTKDQRWRSCVTLSRAAQLIIGLASSSDVDALTPGRGEKLYDHSETPKGNICTTANIEETRGTNTESGLLDINNYRLRHFVSPGAAPPVVLVHGAGGNALWWKPLAEGLRGQRMMGLDLSGHGESSP